MPEAASTRYEWDLTGAFTSSKDNFPIGHFAGNDECNQVVVVLVIFKIPLKMEKKEVGCR